MRTKSWHVIFGLCFGLFLLPLHAYLNAPPRSQAPPRPQAPPPSSSDDTGNRFSRLFSWIKLPRKPNPLAKQLKSVIEALRNENQNQILRVSRYVDEYIDTNNNGPVDVNLVVDTLPWRLIDDLKEKVKALVEAGLEKQCCHEYSSWRRQFIEQYLSTFGLEVDALNDENMMEKTESWKKTFTAAMKILFPNERSLFDRVFDGLELSSAVDISLREFCRQSLKPLLSFANTLVMRNHSRIDDILWQTLDFWLQDLKLMFENQDSFSRLSEVLVLWRTLLLKIDINKRIYSDNGYSFIRTERIIEEVMRKLSNYYADDIGDWVVDEHRPLLSSLNTWLIDRLESHLEDKPEYKTLVTPLKHVYMMNNLNHVKIMAKKLRLKDFLGDLWFTEITKKVKKNLKLNQTPPCNELLNLLKLDSDESLESMKDKLNKFNEKFEEICKEHSERSKWRILDEKLWEQIIMSLEDILLPAYEKFFQRICQVLGNDDDECIKYKPTQIKAQLQMLLRFDIHWEIERKKRNNSGGSII